MDNDNRSPAGLPGSLTAALELPPSPRRALLLAPLLAAVAVGLADQPAFAAKLDPAETQITLPDAIKWTSWTGLPPHHGEMARLYGDLNADGPYLVLMKWYPGYMSAPHTYRTDRLSLVLSGTWWVNSGADFDPANTIPVPAGGFVRRVAGTPHYDGVKRGARQPAVIALFGVGPVDFALVDPSKPAWRGV
ncbi:MAG TPA: cupin domain-containing protein [Acetobacteraceae bacterium]|nr:cupin domain-containing protein [Acetobacteraceae bacterium]